MRRHYYSVLPEIPDVLCRLYTNSEALSAVKPDSCHIIVCFSLPVRADDTSELHLFPLKLSMYQARNN